MGPSPSDYSESDVINVKPARLSTCFAILRAEQKWQCLLLDVTSNVRRVHTDQTAELALTALVIQQYCNKKRVQRVVCFKHALKYAKSKAFRKTNKTPCNQRQG